MTSEEMHINFKIGVDKADTLSTPNFEPEEVDIFLNEAQDRIVKTRYSGNNPFRDSLEETQKRTDDLREVIENAEITPESLSNKNKPNSRFFVLPNVAPEQVYWFAINEEAEIVYKPCDTELVTEGTLTSGSYYIVTSGTITYDSVDYVAPSYILGSGRSFTGTGIMYTAESKRVEVKPITHDVYNKIIKDPFNKPYENQVLRLMFKNQVELIGSENVVPSKLFLRYLRKPQRILLDLSVPSNSVDCELADHLHDEIVGKAVSIALEGIESKRYQSNLNELNKQE